MTIILMTIFPAHTSCLSCPRSRPSAKDWKRLSSDSIYEMPRKEEEISDFPFPEI